MYVLTADQRGSRRQGSRANQRMQELTARYEHDLIMPIAHYAGDELQCITDSAETVTAISTDLVDDGWYVGIGIGRGTLGTTPADSHGPAFELARDAVTEAKSLPWGLAVRGEEPASAADAEAALAMLEGIRSKRTESGRDIAKLAAELGTITAAAEALGISVSAASKRARIALLRHEAAGIPLANRLLEAADMSDAHGTVEP